MARPRARVRQLPQAASPRRSPGKTQKSPRASQNEKLAHKPVGKRLADSDDSDELVIKGQGRRRGRDTQTYDVYASGALGTGDEPNAHPTRAQRRKQLEEAKKNGALPLKSPLASASVSRDKTPAHQPSLQHSQTRSPSQGPAVQPPQHASGAQPTPLHEESILNGIKPRKRQNSILLDPGLDESTLGSFALPEDENSPLHLPKQKHVERTPPSNPPSSGSKKRKLGPDDVPTTPAESSRISELLPQQSHPEPQLPPQPLSTLRMSGQKHRRKTINQDDDEIMAPPMSSSSYASSPAKAPPLPSKRGKSKSKAPPATLTTQELQAQLMPSKRQKSTRNRHAAASVFDIASDTNPDDAIAPSEDEDDSTFLAPSKRKSTKTAPRRQTSATATKATTQASSRRKAADNARNKKKQCTAPAPLLASSHLRSRSTATTATDTDTNAHDQPAKFPSQQQQLSVISAASPPQRPRTRAAGAKGKARSTGKEARSGGSPLKQSFSGRDREVGDKENPGGGAGSGDDELIEVGVEAEARAQEEEELRLPSPKKAAFGGKWAEIDDFEMDFEDVVVGNVSSDPLAR
ncbi:uncharacterized protein HMPREF1541_00396 [Cyphellophora europaea CBS 101466]|uniref:Uncharacterized protein n=1 Tax=Cyphellophora europaea (strain CBS 101466) TaxID=1220924 RepID=W2SBX8_CYPE1|nr:uncharacterized protein HMPREF1541_00396 [Cyphellophora europaea CBS 101466]ETN46212.1 hypothetical protein HMPREF1541_00396 [Cyphellophora europaea CBS 101466]